jgi:hypothetical protein
MMPKVFIAQNDYEDAGDVEENRDDAVNNWR